MIKESGLYLALDADKLSPQCGEFYIPGLCDTGCTFASRIV
jgi:hypothetical protein